jgi:hypothetical protein
MARKYSSIKCFFCNEKLKEHPNKVRYCHCECQYSILTFNNSKRFSVGFRIGDYKFHVSEDCTVVTDLTHNKPTYDSYRADCPIIIDKDNYLSIVDRLKKLQAFS